MIGYSPNWARPFKNSNSITNASPATIPPTCSTRLAAAAIVPLAHARAYTERYSEPDKAAFGMQRAEAWPTPYWLVDASFAAMSILLTAVDEGLGALFFGLRDIPRFRAALGVPEEYHPIGAIIVGHPAPDRPSPSLKRGRRPLGEVVHRGKW